MSLLKELLSAPSRGGEISTYRKSHEVVGSTDGAQEDYQFRLKLDIFSALPTNAGAPQTTPTSDASGQIVHPSILYFPDGWNGYDYWMAMTPYTDTDASVETPEILACDDGVNWVVPAGLTNPIVTDVDATHPNADACLFYNEATDELWVYYQKTSAVSAYSKIYLKKSSDGVNWGGVGLGTLLLSDVHGTFTSPFVVKVNTVYHLWHIDITPSPNVIKHRTSTDGESWSASEDITVYGRMPTGKESWHFEVQYMSEYFEYWILLTIADSDTSGNNTWMMFARSTNGVDWYLYPKVLLKPSGAGWDGNSIYKATFLLDGATLKIWYSAWSGAVANDWYMGYTTATFESTLNLISMLQKMKSDGGDLRFTEDDGSTELNYWIEQFHYGGYIVVYLLLDDIPASPNVETIYMYYGRADATTTENGGNVFIEFENWEGYAVNDTLPLGLFEATSIGDICKVNDNRAFKGSKSLYSEDDDAGDRNQIGWNYADKAAGAFRFLFALYLEDDYGTDAISLNFLRVLGEANITLMVDSNGDVFDYYTAAFHDIGADLTADNWFVFEVCVEINAATWDFRFDGTWYLNRTKRANLDQFHFTDFFLSGIAAKFKGNLGVCAVGKYVDPEPTDGTWGSEEPIAWPF